MIPTAGISRSELRQRFLLFLGIAGAIFLILAARLFYLQIIKGTSYRNLSENNRVRAERLAPPRGMILDRHGEILADTVAAFDALVIPSEVPEEGFEEIFGKVAGILEMDVGEISEVVTSNGPARWRPRLVKRRITRKEMAMLEARRMDLPGFVVSPNPVRHYPEGKMLSTTLGYMGGIGPDELMREEFEDYEGSDYIGKAGIEKWWERELRGSPGGVQVEVDVLGRKLEELTRKRPVPGENLVLAVDRDLQQVAEAALGEEVGSIVVMDVKKGDILAMVSSPGYDPNGLARGLTSLEWKELISDSHHPLQNRPIRGLYAPGSTFKIIMALAGLSEGVITPQTKFLCEGQLNFAGRDFRCWKRAGHGEVDLVHAIESSCDVYFYELGLLLGVDAIHDYSTRFGLGSKTGISLLSEKEGLVPNKSWKRRRRGEIWYPGETLSVAIGQGYLLTTPLQLAVMTAAVAHPSGTRIKPRLVLRTEDSAGELLREFPPVSMGEISFRETHLNTLRKGLEMVVTGDQGTGKRAQVEGFPVAGKTGTAQVVSMKSDDEEGTPEEIAWRHRDHALFVCYAPVDDPQIVVAVVVDHGGHGGSGAAPLARKVIEAYRDLYNGADELAKGVE